MLKALKRFMLGSPLASIRERHERLSIPLALAIFASDALSSTAYATEEILLALVATAYAHQANLLSVPIALAILLLMAVVVISYRQVIQAFPEGGGSYEVAKEMLGGVPSQVAGAALIIDYVLTVAVSISAGVAAVTSTGLLPVGSKVWLALLFLIVITLVNLRGVRESGKVFAFPAYTFIACMLALLAVGGWQCLTGDGALDTRQVLETQSYPFTEGHIPWMSGAMALVLLGGFSHGCAALTGIEAISNGVKAFKEPVAVNANRTMVIMGCILGGIFLGVTFLAFCLNVLPNHSETVISQVARQVFGDGSPMYFMVQLMTMIILVLAANTSYSGFPRLATILAQDGLLPRQLMSVGDRLVYSNGIMALAVLSALLIWLYQADTHSLIPLYAVGVFLSFTLAQAGMVRWHKQHPSSGWRGRQLINLLGAVVTGVVTVILLVEKWAAGAWIVGAAIPLFMVVFNTIQRHYASINKQLSLPKDGYCPIPFEHTALVLVSTLHRGTIPALEYAKTIATKVEAVHVEINPQSTERLRQSWDAWGCGIPLTILKSPYRSITEPLIHYIDEVENRYEHDIVTVIVPEFVTKRFWHNFLHNQTSLLIKTLLRFRKGKVVTTVRYYLDE
ncbi:MAG: APC family permease [Candidatus Melainabacteria bacterium]|nr:APC family permease [Candidatus Melainabacteria bacterium]